MRMSVVIHIGSNPDVTGHVSLDMEAVASRAAHALSIMASSTAFVGPSRLGLLGTLTDVSVR